LKGVKWSLTLHAHSETDFPACVTLPQKLRDADFVVAISKFMVAQAYRILPPELWYKVKLVHCGVDVNRLWNTYGGDKRWRIDEKTRYVCVARLADEKGHAGLLKAFSIVCISNPNAELILVGDGPARARLTQQVFDMGLNHKVKFFGAQPEIMTLSEIAKADCLVLGSFMEGIPVVMLEAMALQTPFVVPSVAGIPEVCTNSAEPHGYMFSPTDWEQLAHKMKLAVREDAASRARKILAWLYVKSEFNSKTEAEKLGHLFND